MNDLGYNKNGLVKAPICGHMSKFTIERGLCDTCYTKARKRGDLESFPKLPNSVRWPLKPSNMINLSEVEKAYLAGIFDGEGSVWIYRRKKENHYYVRIAVTNTNTQLLEFVAVKSGIGKIVQNTLTKRYTNITSKYHPNWKPCYYWYADGQMCGEFLKVVAPFLIPKKERVELALEFQEGRNNRSLTKEQEKEYYDRLKKLNTRGIKE